MDRPFYTDDVVANKSKLKQLGIVERTHDDIETHEPYPGKAEFDKIAHDKSISQAAYRRFMKDGIPPKDTVLVRSFMIGDIVKRNARDAMSGVVLNTFTKCTLQPICPVTYQGSHSLYGILPPSEFNPASSQFYYPHGKPAELRDIPALELMSAEGLGQDDLVIYNNWIGRVQDFQNAIHIKLSDKCVVEIMEEQSEHVNGSVGDCCVGDLVKTKKGVLRTGRWIYGQYNPNTPPVGTVVNIRTVKADINWLERRIGPQATVNPPHYELEAAELESESFRVYDKTRRPSGLNPEDVTVSNSEFDVSLNMRVRFKDLTGACLKYSTSSNPIPRLNRADHLGYDINVFDVTQFRTDLTVMWQDSTISTEHSIDLVPDASIDDEHAAWPGEIVHTLGLSEVPGMTNVVQPERIGVVRSVNAEERMAKVTWLPDSFIHYATNQPNPDVRRMIARQISGAVDLRVGEVSLYDVEAPAMTNVRRGDMVLITQHTTPEQEQPGDITWLGEIVDTPLDGYFRIRLGAASEVKDIMLQRQEAVIAVRSDGTENVQEWQGDEGAEVNSDDYSEDEDDFDDDLDSDMGSEEVAARYEDENGMSLDEEDVEDDDWESADEGDEVDVEMHDAAEHLTPPAPQPVAPVHDSNTVADGVVLENGERAEQVEGPSPYSVLEGEPPTDHHYRHEPSILFPAHLKRTAKEHKILRNPSTLPDGVYIRTWETRLDLLRVLLVGPTETPYSNAPFIIDFFLHPNFPLEPPKVHFHSWPPHASIGTVGRVNPNLYEDGKICLSLLGTWEAGAQGENWHGTRSTLLQVIVSILGLVLVREPFYNEAGYEALVGTEASKRSSALYSERVFLRAKGFLITALDKQQSASGLMGLEDVITWLYRHAAGPKLLNATIREVEEVLERSDGSLEADGLTVMSKGAAIPAKRLLDRLRELASGSEQEQV